jgi:hypothetical protein
MIVDIASEKLAICHWVADGQRSEGVFDTRTLEMDTTGQQSTFWPEDRTPSRRRSKQTERR